MERRGSSREMHTCLRRFAFATLTKTSLSVTVKCLIRPGAFAINAVDLINADHVIEYAVHDHSAGGVKILQQKNAKRTVLQPCCNVKSYPPTVPCCLYAN